MIEGCEEDLDGERDLGGLWDLVGRVEEMSWESEREGVGLLEDDCVTVGETAAFLQKSSVSPANSSYRIHRDARPLLGRESGFRERDR
jgi:hypothetical protein